MSTCLLVESLGERLTVESGARSLRAMNTITTTPDMAALSEEEILAALDELEDNPDTTNPIVLEVERLVEAYTERFEEKCRESQEVPEDALLYEPDSAVEQVAFDIFTEALHDSLLDADEDE